MFQMHLLQEELTQFFIPVISNASPEGYQFEIFSRWGQRILNLLIYL